MKMALRSTGKNKVHPLFGKVNGGMSSVGITVPACLDGVGAYLNRKETMLFCHISA